MTPQRDISLIPKNLGPQKGSGVSGAFKIVSRILMAVFTICLLASAGLYFYNNSLSARADDLHFQLEEVNKSKELTQDIGEIQMMEKRLLAIKDLFSRHIYATNIFDYIEKHTHRNVRYTSFSYLINKDANNNKKADISMDAEATDVESISKQIVAYSGGQNKSSGIDSQDEPVDILQAEEAGPGTDMGVKDLQIGGYTFQFEEKKYKFNLNFVLPQEYLNIRP